MRKDGWHSINDVTDVYIEDGKILRGARRDGIEYNPVRPFKICKDGTWALCTGVLWDTFRRGVKQGRYILH